MDASTAQGILQGGLAESAARFSTVTSSHPALERPSPWWQDEETLHVARVQLRRIRANLRTFHVLVDPRWGTMVRAEIGWLDSQLGAARDLDIVAATISVNGPLVLRPGVVSHLMATVNDDVATARMTMADALVSDRARTLVATIAEMITSIPGGNQVDTAKPEMLRGLLTRAYRDVRSSGQKARLRPTTVHLHQVRIRTKSLRYGAELLIEHDGAHAAHLASAAEHLQSRLGAVHDVANVLEWLDRHSADDPHLSARLEPFKHFERGCLNLAQDGWKKDLRAIDRRWAEWMG